MTSCTPEINTDFELVCCDYCGSQSHRQIYSLRDSLSEWNRDIHLVQCQNCSLVFINPRPKQDALPYFYPPTFVSYQFVKSASLRFWDLKGKILNAIVDKISAQRILFLKKIIDLEMNLNLSDYGCGRGYFLKALEVKSKFSLSGFDFDQASVDYCVAQGLNVKKEINAHAGEECQFDVITLWHFLEHSISPVATIRQLKTQLVPNGIVVIEVPNWESIESSVFGRKSYLLDPPRHLYQFSKKSLSQILEREGFDIIAVDCCHGEGGWLGSLQNIFFGGILFKNFRSSVISILFLSILVLPIDIITSWTRRGSILRLVAKKRM